MISTLMSIRFLQADTKRLEEENAHLRKEVSLIKQQLILEEIRNGGKKKTTFCLGISLMAPLLMKEGARGKGRDEDGMGGRRGGGREVRSWYLMQAELVK